MLKKQRNIISIGDSLIESNATKSCTKGFSNTYTKTIKLSERPTINQLEAEQILLTNCFSYIHDSNENLDLRLTITID